MFISCPLISKSADTIKCLQTEWLWNSTGMCVMYLDGNVVMPVAFKTEILKWIHFTWVGILPDFHLSLETSV